MLKGKQTVMGLDTYENEATQNTHVNTETKKKQKLWFLGNDITHTRTSQHMHEFSLSVQARSCVRRSLPRKPNLHRNRAEAKQNIKYKIQQPNMLKDIKKT